jgi:hypothetical protein
MSAAQRFEEALAVSSSRPEPYLRLAECRLAQRDATEAARVLDEALRGGVVGSAALWDQWFRVQVVELGRSPGDLLREFPLPAGKSPRDVAGRGADLYWLLENLVKTGAIRVNCGGPFYADNGVEWGRDRFYVQGAGMLLPKMGRFAGIDGQVVYRTERYFWEGGQILPGYRFPLPNGAYRVTLHFAEGWFEEKGKRRFDTWIEGIPVLEDYEPLQNGFGEPEAFEYETSVEDGSLDLDFRRRVENPKISAIAIEAQTATAPPSR